MNTIDEVKNEVGKQFKTGKGEVKKSAKDWYDYVEKHPLQSMLFGTVVYFAVKGLFK